MLCDKCRQNEANVHVTRIVNGVKYEQNLCSHCAQQESAQERYGFGGSGLEQLVNFLRGIGMIGVVMAPGAGRSYQMSAPTSIEDLGLTLPSCGEDGGAAKGTSIEALKAELTSAVANEKYERAAELRDEIFQMEQQQGQN